MNILTEDIIKLGIAVLVGGAIGLEREVQYKAAGFRTIILITLGSTLFTLFSIAIEPNPSPSRIASNIVTGIGFLGAGVILTREGSVLGVTSAATIWVLAAIGVLAGEDRNIAAITVATLTVGILVGVNILESAFASLQHGVHTRIKRLRRKNDREGL